MQLTPFELLHAAHVGISRNVSAIRDGRPLEHGRSDDGWERHIDGAIGEYVLSRHLDICWKPAVGHLDTELGDVGSWQVKTTRRPNGSLIVRPHDPPQFNYALVTLALPYALLVGYVSGVRAKEPIFWRNVDQARGIHRAAYFVPQDQLLPFGDPVHA